MVHRSVHVPHRPITAEIIKCLSKIRLEWRPKISGSWGCRVCGEPRETRLPGIEIELWRFLCAVNPYHRRASLVNWLVAPIQYTQYGSSPGRVRRSSAS